MGFWNWLKSFVRQVAASRHALSQTLQRGGGEVTPSQGNFVLVRFDNAVWVRDALAGMGIAVRAFAESQGAIHVELMVAADRAKAGVFQVLTLEQREQLEEMRNNRGKRSMRRSGGRRTQ